MQMVLMVPEDTWQTRLPTFHSQWEYGILLFCFPSKSDGCENTLRFTGTEKQRLVSIIARSVSKTLMMMMMKIYSYIWKLNKCKSVIVTNYNGT